MVNLKGIMNQSLRSQLVTPAYLAGFFDGEGCVTLGQNGSIALGIVNTNLPILNLFKEVLGGTVASRLQMVNKPQYVWRTYGPTAVSAGEVLLPFLIEKREQMEVVIDWFKTRDRFEALTRQGRKGKFANPARAEAILYTQTMLTKMKKGTHIEQPI